MQGGLPVQGLKAEIGVVGGGKPGNFKVHQPAGQRQYDQRDDPAQAALQDAQLKKRPSDKGIGGPDQLGHLDFVAQGQDLQPDGVEGNGDQAHC